MRNIKFRIITLMIISIILSCILFANVSTAANTISSADLYSKGYTNNLIKYQGVHLETDFVVYKKDGVEYPAYCLQQNLHGVAGDDKYSVSVDSLISNVMVWRVITNGYPYKTYQELGCSNKEQAFMATKQAVYCILYDRNVNDYTSMNENGDKCLNALKTIVANAKKSTATKISSNITVKPINTKWEIDSINSKYVSLVYTANATGPMSKYIVSISGKTPEGTFIADEQNRKKTTFNSGEKFKVLIPIINLTENGNFTINVDAEVETKPILYGKSSDSTRQDYALTAASYEDGQGSTKAYYTKNLTKLTILKQENSTKKPLQGVQFEVLDSNQKVVYTGLVTDKNGLINIDNLLPGKYFVKEIRTLEGYTLYDKLIDVELDLNEISKIIVNNSAQTVTIENENPESEREVGKSESEKEVESSEKETVIENDKKESEKEIESKEENKTIENESKNTQTEVESKEEERVIEVENKTSTTVVKLPKTGF